MPLNDQEWFLVHCIVRDELLTLGEPYSLLKQYFPHDFNSWNISTQITSNADMIISVAQRSSIGDTEPFSISLLKQLVRLPVFNSQKADDLARLRAYLERLSAEQAAANAIDHYSVSFIPGTGLPFIDREPVRVSLKRLIEPNPNPLGATPLILHVSGENDTGTSHPFCLIQYLAAVKGFPVAVATLSSTSTAEDVTSQLAMRMDLNREPPTSQDPAKRVNYWAIWLVEQARQSSPGRPWWFVVDQCNELDPGSDAVELIAQLANELTKTTPLDSRRSRLVLLGHNDRLSQLPLRRAIAPQVRVELLTAADLYDYFMRVFTETGSANTQPDELEELVKLAVEEVLDIASTRAQQDGVSFMSALSQAAEETVDEFRR